MSANEFRALVKSLYILRDELKEERKKQDEAESLAEALEAKISEINETAKKAKNYHGKILIVDGRCFEITSWGFRELEELT